MRVVLDANVWISFLLTRGETIASIFEAWEKEKFGLLVTEEIILEIEQVVERLSLKGVINYEDAQALVRRLKKNTEPILSFSDINISSDKNDNRYLACALDGEADYLVTGDKKHLLPLKKIGKTQIISPKEFVKAFRA